MTYSTRTTPYLPPITQAQHHYVEFTTREHWLRQQLHKVRAQLWKSTNAAEQERLQAEEATVEWLRAEAEHRLVYWRSVLHAQGVQAI
jgi:hypothetical protein